MTSKCQHSSYFRHHLDEFNEIFRREELSAHAAADKYGGTPHYTAIAMPPIRNVNSGLLANRGLQIGCKQIGVSF